MEEHPAASGLASPTHGNADPRSAYAVVIEAGSRNCSADAPDLPGCVATGGTLPEVTRRIRRAIAMHTAGLLHDGLPVPPPRSAVTMVDAPAELAETSEVEHLASSRGRS